MKFYRLNQQIRAAQLRVLDEDGKQIGLLQRDEAIRKAQELGTDLVEIAPNAVPPVARLIDFKKFKYQEDKRDRESKKKTKASGTKELRLGPFMSDNDFSVRVKRAIEFLNEGHKVRIVVKFAGRQITHPEFGWQMIRKFIEQTASVGKVDREPKLEGKLLVVFLSPGKGSHETENKESSNQTVQNN